MKKRFSLILLLAIILVFSGCAYVHVKEPFDTDLDKTIRGDKEGKASYQSILWLIAWGDAGTAAAAKDGEITVLNHIDKEILCILFGLYYKETTILYGD